MPKRRKRTAKKRKKISRFLHLARISIISLFCICLLLSVCALSMRHIVLEKLKNRAISSNALLYSKPISINANKNIRKLKLVSRLKRLGYSLTKDRDLAPGQFRITPCLLYTSPSPRDATLSRMPSSA